jgi:hypothetical protein
MSSFQYVKTGWDALPGVTVGAVVSDAFVETLTDINGNPTGTVLHQVPLSVEITLSGRKFRATAAQAGINPRGQFVYELAIEEWKEMKERRLFLSTLLIVRETNGTIDMIRKPPYQVGWDGTEAEKQRLIRLEENVQRTVESRTHEVLFVQTTAEVKES